MPFNIVIPKADGSNVAIITEAGQIVFVLGANGAGKSRLMQYFFTINKINIVRITAQRQNWFNESSISITPASRTAHVKEFLRQDSDDRSAWSEWAPEKRIEITLFDLFAEENNRARRITSAIDGGKVDEAKSLSDENTSPIKMLNELLMLSNLPIEISITDEGQLLASKSGGTPYGINELSDGERNALIIISSVITAKPGSLILIDEPERHLHHSISSPLLSLLFAKRPDCVFVISTHDIMLPTENEEASILLIRGCTFTPSGEIMKVSAWDFDILSGGTKLDEGTKEEILGSRRKMLFIEGVKNSMDTPLYSLVFPGVSIIPKESCREVEKSVTAIRNEKDAHWVKAFGIIDSDGRSAKDITQLKTQGVYALPFYSVEAIYYHPHLQKLIAERQASILGGTAEGYLNTANINALKEIRKMTSHLSIRIAEKAVREQVFKNMPNKTTMQTGGTMNVTINIGSAISIEEALLTGFLDANDFISILKRYPIRETGAINSIVHALQFSSRANYESAVIKLLMDDAKALEFVKSLLDPLPNDMAN